NEDRVGLVRELDVAEEADPRAVLGLAGLPTQAAEAAAELAEPLVAAPPPRLSPAGRESAGATG
ncbi:MAG: hypothetical protein ACK58T_18025, partial [Phycisphaerae bacterium]